MNLDIKNFQHYRLTSQGGKTFQLFNRKNDNVYSINKTEYDYITTSSNPFGACIEVEYWTDSKPKKGNSIDVA